MNSLFSCLARGLQAVNILKWFGIGSGSVDKVAGAVRYLFLARRVARGTRAAGKMVFGQRRSNEDSEAAPIQRKKAIPVCYPRGKAPQDKVFRNTEEFAEWLQAEVMKANRKAAGTLRHEAFRR